MNKSGLAEPKNVQLPAAVARRVERLRSRNLMRELRREAHRMGVAAWIVGGVPRDLWLGRPILDVDVAVGGDALLLGRELERLGAGRLVPLSAEPPRVFRLAGRRLELDLAEIERGSIQADLGRRDFTVNAIALPLAGGPPLDPFGGLPDLRSRRLRAVAARNFSDDPLRTLRAARFMATHGLTPDRAMLSICRRAAPGLASVAPERVRTELARLLEAERAAPALAWAGRAGLLPHALGRKIPRRIAARLARRAISFDHPEVLRVPPGQRLTVRLALIAQALELSPGETASWLSSRRWSRGEAGAAAAVLELAREALVEDSWRWVHRAGLLASQALAVLATAGTASRRLARRLARRAGTARRGPRFAGTDVMSWADIAPGPRVGQLLAELEIAALSGRVRTRREGRKWLLKRAIIPSS